MITETILEFFGNIIAKILETLPELVIPAWMYGVPLFFESLFLDLYKLQKFVPLEAIFNVMIFLLVAQIAYIATKITRILLSTVSGGGGAT